MKAKHNDVTKLCKEALEMKYLKHAMYNKHISWINRELI